MTPRPPLTCHFCRREFYSSFSPKRAPFLGRIFLDLSPPLSHAKIHLSYYPSLEKIALLKYTPLFCHPKGPPGPSPGAPKTLIWGQKPLGDPLWGPLGPPGRPPGTPSRRGSWGPGTLYFRLKYPQIPLFSGRKSRKSPHFSPLSCLIFRSEQ